MNLPDPDEGVGDDERARRLTEVLDQIEHDHDVAQPAA